MNADFPARIALMMRQTRSLPGRVLDVGCGKGYFVKACRDRGIEAEGIDISTTAVAFATDTLRVPARCSDIEQLASQAPESFDTITFWATIEHLPRPTVTLRALFSLLRPGGSLLLDTGVGDDWLDRLLPGAVQWYDPPQHCFVFSAVAMRRILTDCGFAVDRLDPAFERSYLRRSLKFLRNGFTALLLRLTASAGRLDCGSFDFTRFPMGNLMTVAARRPANTAQQHPEHYHSGTRRT